MRQGEDDKSALSYVTVTVDDLMNTPRIAGKAVGLSGGSLADWWSVSSGVGRSEVADQLEADRSSRVGVDAASMRA
jgi:hypothetical protein